MSSTDRPLKIFVVENHEDTVQYMRMFLEQLGHEVAVAKDMESALRDIPAFGANVLISDIGLPDGDGWELLDRLGGGQNVYPIAMSGFGMNADRARSRAVGYRKHLIKPFLPEELEKILDDIRVELASV